MACCKKATVIMPAKRFEFSKTFREERCDFCGLCFRDCPVLEFPIEQARAEIHALIEGRESQALARCTGCMACNTICPHDANPHTLILARWNERYQREGIPMRGRLVLPYQRPNLYTVLLDALPDDEKARVAAWERNWREPSGSETMIYAGCNLLLQPFLLDSPMYDGIPIFGSLDLCCGEPLYRMGCWDAVNVVAHHLHAEFDRMGFKRLIVPCLAGYHLFTHVYPKIFGVSFQFEIVSWVDWITGRIRDGEVCVAPLRKRAVLHDSCWPKASGEACFDATRELLGLLGVEIVEPPHAREKALCCGMCAPAARFSLRDALRAAKTRQAELDEADADMAIVDCAGCNWLFAVADRLSLSKRSKPLYDLFEVTQMAAGEEPKRRTDQRAASIVSRMAGRLGLSYLTPGRFHIEDVLGKPVTPWESDHTS